MKKSLLLFISIFFASVILSQNCIINVDSLAGRYTGGCKNGKANGFGTASGIDSYTGNFKNGYPDGEGKYTWRNGTWYDGNWKDGLFDGNGTLNRIDETNPDSATLITGFWKAGKYAGKFQKPYFIVALTNGINEASGRKVGTTAEIQIAVTSTTAGGSSLYVPLLPKPKLINIDLVEGLFVYRIDNETSPLTNRYTLKNVTFPFSAILTFETTGTNPKPLALEKIKIELSESSKWYIQVKIDN